MLDYILSRLVLLAFLLLVLGLLVAYQDFLGAFFLSGSAKGLAIDVGEKLRSVALNLTTSVEVKKVRLPPVLQAGPVRTGYTLAFGCLESGDTITVGIGVKDPKGRLLHVYSVDLSVPGKRFTVTVPKEDIEGGRTIRIIKNQTVNSIEVSVEVCEAGCGRTLNVEETKCEVGG